MARTPAQNRRYYESRIQRLMAQGFTRSQARGKPAKGEPTVREVQAEAKRRKRTVRQVNDTRRLLGPKPAKSSRALAGRNQAGEVGVSLDTRNQRDAKKALRRAGREYVQVIGTRSDHTGVPLYGAGIGTKAGNMPRPQHGGEQSGGSQGTGTYGHIRADEFLRIVEDQYDGDLWDAIDGESGDDYGFSTAPVTTVHLFFTGMR